mgnify:CR=1 FL=1
MLKLFIVAIVLITFMVLTCGKECKPEQNCELKCCTIPKGDVFCRASCLGLSCELDVDCDGDCCVKSTCSSCLFKRIFTAPTTILETTESNIAVEVGPKNGEIAKCSRFNNHCASKCCVDGKCVDSSRCTPKKAPRRGGVGRIRYGRGGSSSSGDVDWPAWAWGVLVGGVVLLLIIIFLVKKFCYKVL